MKILGSCCVGLAVLAGAVFVFAGKDSPPRIAEEQALSGFVKPGDRAGLIENKEPSGLVLRVLSKKDLELIEHARDSDENVPLIDEKAFQEEMDKQSKREGEPFALLKGMFSADDLNALLTQGLRAIRIGTVVTVNANYVVLSMDEKGVAPEILIPLAQIRRLEKGGTIFNMR